MKVSVFDTYVRRKDGVTMHFDIIVQKENASFEEVAWIGKKFLEVEGLQGATLTSKECEFCHIEEASDEIIAAIDQQGYYILKMENIPSDCPENPTRWQLILYIRATSSEYRFANFRGYTQEQLLELKEQLV